MENIPKAKSLFARMLAEDAAAELNAPEILGTYLTNRSLIRLGPQAAAFLAGDASATFDGFATLVHEYGHFLHNFSTIAGFYDLIAQLRTARHFLEGLDEQGNISGSSDPHMAELMKWRVHLRGQKKPRLNWVTRIDGVTFADPVIDEDSVTVGLKPQTIVRATLKFDVSQGTEKEVASLVVGADVLMEGIAWEFERILLANAHLDVEELDKGYSLFPYKICRAFFEQRTLLSPTPSQFAKLLLLALLSSDPGEAFLKIVACVHQQPAGIPLDGIIEALKENATQFLATARDQAFALIDLEVGQFGTDNRIFRAVKRFVDSGKSYLAQRFADPFFDVKILESSRADNQVLRGFFESFGLCPIITEDGKGKRNLFLIDNHTPDETINEWGVLQSFLEFGALHLLSDGFCPTNKLPEKPCEFIGVCGSPFAINSPEICGSKPWKSFSPGESAGCWYSQSISTAVSLGKLARTSAAEGK